MTPVVAAHHGRICKRTGDGILIEFQALTQKTIAVVHFVQEDSPDEIGRAVAGWMSKL